MKILSYDIGILNLAFAMGNFNEETKELVIEEWGIINLIEDEINAQHKCSHISKMRPYRQCKHIAISRLANKTSYYCKNHLKKYHEEYSFDLEKLGKDEEVCQCSIEECSKKARYIFQKMFKLCPSHKVKKEKYWKANNKLKKIKKITCKDYPISKLADKMIKVLDEKYTHLLDCDVVLLELQPCFTAPKMKTVSSYLSMYYRIRGKHGGDKRIDQIKYYKATNKLEFNNNNDDETKGCYKNRKKTGIQNVNDYLDSVNDMKNKIKFNSHKKKDDLADALLQILSYLKSNKKLI